MKISELIELADLLDKKGEFDAANEVDGLIKNAIGESKTNPTVEELGWGESENDPVVSGLPVKEDEPDMPSEKALETKRRQNAALDEITRMTESFGENKLSFLYEALDHLQYLIHYYQEDKTAEVFNQLSKVADDLDNIGAIREANLIDDFIEKYAAEPMENESINPEAEGTDPNLNAQSPTNNVSIMELIKSLNKAYDNLKATQGLSDETKSHLEKLLSDAERVVYSQYTDMVGEEVKRVDELKQLSSAADSLDSDGHVKEADMIDEFIQKYADIMDYNEDRKEEGDTEQSKRYDSKYHHNLQIREPKREQERVDREGRKEHHINTYQPHEGHLSQRDCPEHIGVMLGRVGPGTYQCPKDGAIFNWETGYTTFDGKQVPGGSVAEQTPSSTGYAIPHRIFDSREKTLNVIH